MKHRVIATLGASALVLTSGLVGVALMTGTTAFAGSPSDSANAKVAAASAAQARKALSDGKPFAAIGFAEAAVARAPQNQSYRAMLGQAYLLSGRFASARDAFGDALALSPNDGRSALSYALAQIANGDWTGARQTLDSHAETIAVADRGLAIALAGDPASAVELLTPAARAPGADAKTRQNLALSLALAGRWPEARSVAAVDLAPGDLDKRMVDWAVFARPAGAADQVAALLKVIPVQDVGQPVALALNARVASQPVAVAAIEPAPKPPVEVADAPVTEAPRPAIVFGPREEVVQPLPPVAAKPVRVAAKPVAAKVAAAKPTVAKPAPVAPKVMAVAATVPVSAPAKGKFYLQLGAFESAAVAQDGWKRAVRRFPAFAGQTPSGMNFKTGAGNFYRLSVGGFSRADAVAMCQSYRSHGGNCFVREAAGDQNASWTAATKAATKQVASR
ncbi:MAG: sporulation protein [Sphingobium sp.]|nr:sporulation protein [Sphingobium sp.]